MGYQAIVMFILPGESIPIALMATATFVVILIGELVGVSLGPSVAGYLSNQSTLAAAIWFLAILSALVMRCSFGYKETLNVVAKNSIDL